MKRTIVEYPDGLPGLLKLSDEQFGSEVKFLAAAKLYEMGKLSSGKASDMAGIGRLDFLKKLGTYGFNAINLSDEQIGAELKAVSSLYDIGSVQFRTVTVRVLGWKLSGQMGRVQMAQDRRRSLSQRPLESVGSVDRFLH